MLARKFWNLVWNRSSVPVTTSVLSVSPVAILVTCTSGVNLEFTQAILKSPTTYLFLHICSDLRLAQLPVQLFEAGEKGEAEAARHHVSRLRPLLPALLPAPPATPPAPAAEVGLDYLRMHR